MRQILLFAALATSLALLSGCTLSKTKADTAEDMTGKAAYQKISAEDAYEMMVSQEVVVVDVRTREEYDGGHIENAVLVPNESIGRESTGNGYFCITLLVGNDKSRISLYIELLCKCFSFFFCVQFNADKLCIKEIAYLFLREYFFRHLPARTAPVRIEIDEYKFVFCL